MTYLIDSDILIDFFNKAEPGEGLVKEFLKEGNDVVISVLSITEICAGWSEKESKVYLPLLYDLFPVMPVTKEVAELSGRLRYEYRHNHQRKLKTIDTTIAATAITKGFHFATKNLKDYPMPELKLYTQ